MFKICKHASVLQPRQCVFCALLAHAEGGDRQCGIVPLLEQSSQTVTVKPVKSTKAKFRKRLFSLIVAFAAQSGLQD